MYGIMTGNQPPGTMTVKRDRNIKLEGSKFAGAIVIDYYFPNGKQGVRFYAMTV